MEGVAKSGGVVMSGMVAVSAVKTNLKKVDRRKAVSMALILVCGAVTGVTARVAVDWYGPVRIFVCEAV
jgi:hypothetical protein